MELHPKCHGEKSINVEHVTCLYIAYRESREVKPRWYFLHSFSIYIFRGKIKRKVKRKSRKTKPANNRSLWGLGDYDIRFYFYFFFSLFPF